jgi:hypothetical protein
MGGAQITTIALLALGFGMTAAKHGQPRTGTYSVNAALIAVAVNVALLWWGGFWS